MPHLRSSLFFPIINNNRGGLSYKPGGFLRSPRHYLQLKCNSFNLQWQINDDDDDDDELICTCEFFKKLKLHWLKWFVQFELFKKLIGAN